MLLTLNVTYTFNIVGSWILVVDNTRAIFLKLSALHMIKRKKPIDFQGQSCMFKVTFWYLGSRVLKPIGFSKLSVKHVDWKGSKPR